MATVGDLKVNISTNTSAFNRGMQDVNRQLKLAQAEFRNASSSLKDFGKGTEGLRSKSDYLTKSVDLQRQKVQALKEQYEKTKKETGENSKQTQNMAIQYNNAQAKLNKLEKDLKTTNETIKVQESRWTKLGDKLKNVGSKMQQAGKKMTDIGKDMTMKVTTPLVGIGTASAKMAMDFGDNMANINTLLDDTKHLDSYKKKVLEVSNETGINAKVMSEGMYQAISSLGDGGKETEKIFGTMAKSAKAGKAEVADSVSLISSNMKGYGQINDATAKKISDLAFTTAKLGVTTFPEMAKSMQPLFPLSSSLGFSMEELYGSMATLTGVTGNTSEVSTQLKAVFSNLMKPTKQMSELISKYGYENAQSMIKSEGMTGVLKILQKETGGQSDKLAELFSSTEAITALTALTGENFGDFETKLKKMNETTGATDTALKKVNDTTGNKLKESLNKLKNAGIQLGDSLTPIISKFSDIIGKLADKFNNLTPAQQETIVKLGLFVASIGPVIGVIGKAIEIGGKMTDIFGKISGAVGGAGGVIGFLTSPIGIAIVAIGSIIAIGITLYKNWDKIKEKAGQLGKHIKEKWNGMKEHTKQTWSNMKKNTAESWKIMQSKVKEHGGGIKGFVGAMGEGMKKSWGQTFSKMDSLTGGKLSSIHKKIKDILGKIKEKFRNMFNVKIKMPHIPVPHFKKEGKFSLNPPSLPHFSFGGWYAKGGVFDRASLIGVGENGREAVMPLERNTGWIDELASKLNAKGGNGDGKPIVINLDGREIARVTTPYISNNLATNTRGRR